EADRDGAVGDGRGDAPRRSVAHGPGREDARPAGFPSYRGRALRATRHCPGGTGVVPDGPIPMTWTTTSPSLAQAKCGCRAGSVHTLPAGSARILLSSKRSP